MRLGDDQLRIGWIPVRVASLLAVTDRITFDAERYAHHVICRNNVAATPTNFPREVGVKNIPRLEIEEQRAAIVRRALRRRTSKRHRAFMVLVPSRKAVRDFGLLLHEGKKQFEMIPMELGSIIRRYGAGDEGVRIPNEYEVGGEEVEHRRQWLTEYARDGETSHRLRHDNATMFVCQHGSVPNSLIIRTVMKRVPTERVPPLDQRIVVRSTQVPHHGSSPALRYENVEVNPIVVDLVLCS